MIKPKTATIFLVLCFLTMLFQSCRTLENTRFAKNPVRIRFSTWQGDYPLVLAEALGLYEKNGVKVDLVYMEDYKNSLRSFVNLEIDTTNAILSDALIVAQSEDFQTLWIQDKAIISLVSTNAIQSVDELRGHRIGIDMNSSIASLMLDQILARNGISKDEVTIVNVNSKEIVTAVGESIDAGLTVGIPTQELIEEGVKIVGQFSSESPGVMIFHKDWIIKNPETAKGLVNAWSEAVIFWESNPRESFSLMTPYYLENHARLSQTVNDSVILFSRQKNIEAFSPGGKNSLYEEATLNMNYLIAVGNLLQLPNLDGLVNWQFVGMQNETTND